MNEVLAKQDVQKACEVIGAAEAQAGRMLKVGECAVLLSEKLGWDNDRCKSVAKYVVENAA